MTAARNYTRKTTPSAAQLFAITWRLAVKLAVNRRTKFTLAICYSAETIAKMLRCRSKTLRKKPSKILQADSLTPIPWLIHGFSTRPGGFSRVYGGKSLNLGFTREDSRRAVEQNRAAFLRQLGAIRKGREWPLITAAAGPL